MLYAGGRRKCGLQESTANTHIDLPDHRKPRPDGTRLHQLTIQLLLLDRLPRNETLSSNLTGMDIMTAHCLDWLAYIGNIEPYHTNHTPLNKYPVVITTWRTDSNYKLQTSGSQPWGNLAIYPRGEWTRPLRS